MYFNWQDCDGSSFFIIQHWIRLEMQADILVKRLYMRVEPSDSSYMPSLVVVSAGDSINSMKELKTINIGQTDTLVTLLQDLGEVGLLLYLSERKSQYITSSKSRILLSTLFQHKL